MRIPCTIEWRGHREGWQATARLEGGPITVTQQKSFALARRRLLAAVEAAGVAQVDLDITARLPKAIESGLSRYRELAQLIPALTVELDDLKLELAQRLCNELNFSEREVGIWLGVSGAHISAKLRAMSVDTGEYRRDGGNEVAPATDPDVARPADAGRKKP